MKFTHLHTHSHYSLLDGLAKIDDLVNRAKELGMDSLAITDHGNLYGAVEFYKKAKSAGIKPIIGVEAYIMPEANSTEKYYHMILLCQNQTGWKNLLKLLTHASLEGFYYKPRINKDFLRQHSEGLIALSGCISGEVGRAILNNQMAEAERAALHYLSIFGQGKFFLEIGHHPGIKETIKVREGVIKLSQKTGIPLAATQDIHYLKKGDAEYHDILLAVQTGNKLNDPDRLSLKEDDFSMRSPEEMAELFKDVPEAVSNTQLIADQCNLEITLNKIHLPKFEVPEGDTNISYLRKLIDERASKRYPEITQAVTERINYEIGVIEKMGFADYFLIVQDFVNWAKERGIVVGPGRGSAAGSIVSYILGITNVDPLKYDLLFERFLNPERVQMPDIDIDITDRRRDEVMGYLTEKYGVDHVAHIITFGTMAARAAIRDVGRAMGISYGFCDQLAKLIPFNTDLEEAMKMSELATIYQQNPDAKKILDAAKKMEGVARHASMHACGIVISKEPLTDYLPLQKAPQNEDKIITQFEMHSVEDLGLLKMDLLGLKNLTIIEDTVRLVHETCDIKPETPGYLDINNLPAKDEKTFKILQEGDTTGVFQFESSGMRRYMKELKPTELEDLVALVALYRPGPMDLIPTYIKRKHGLEKVSYLHPKLEKILKNTHGVGVYQEQMMSIARDLAGYSLAQADTLRKAIGKKIKSLLDEQQEKLTQGMIANGIDPRTANAIWELFPPFARYGFNRCLTGETEVIDAETGLPVKINDLIHNPQLIKKAATLNDESDLKISTQKVLAVIPNGKKPVFKVRTRSGRQIRATQNHPFYGIHGWQLLEKLNQGDKIAVPRRLPEPQKPLHLPKHKLAVLGYLLAEGNFCHPNGFYFYSKSDDEVRDYAYHLEQFRNTVAKTNNSKPATSVYSKRRDLRQPSEAVEWIDTTGLRYKKATEKFFPTFVYSLANKNLAVLIAKMFQGDGCINTKRGDPQIFYATSSQKIAGGLQRLLLRFGILSTIHQKRFKYRGGIKIGYTVTINRFNNIQKFVENFSEHLVGKKRIIAESIKTEHPIINGSLPVWSARGSKDTIPATVARPLIRTGVATAGFTFSEFAKTTGIAERLFLNDDRKIGYLRETIGFIGGVLKNSEIIKHAESDIYWDEIVSIEFDGVEETFDLSMETNHNFIANDIFVHNSHAVCYAVIGYQTAYLKAHYPVEFMASLFNADAGDVDRISFLVSECQKMDIQVLPPDVNKSSASFTVDGNNIRFGLTAVKNVGENIIQAIIEEREKSGPFANFATFLQRVQHKDLNKKSLESLTKCGALDSLGIERNLILLNIDDVIKFNQALKKSRETNQMGLFAHSPANNSLKLKAATPATSAEKLTWEKELLGLYVSDHPLNAYRAKLQSSGAKSIKEVLAVTSSTQRHNVGGMIAKIQKIVTKLGQPMLFAKIEDFSNAMEIIVFSDTLEKTSAVWQENKPVLISGRMSFRNGEPKLICDSAKEL